MVNVPAAPLEGSINHSTENRPMLFMTEDDGGGGLRAVLFAAANSSIVNDQRLGVLAVAVDNQVDVEVQNATLDVEVQNTTLDVEVQNTTLNVEDVNRPTIPAVDELELTDADTEYDYVLPANCKRFEFNCRESVDIRFAYTTGQVASTGPYRTLRAGASYFQSNVDAGGITLYFASSAAGVTVEIEVWS